MIDADVSRVKYAVEQYLRNSRFDVGKPAHFDLLIDHASLRLAHVPVDDEFRLVAAMCYLGLSCQGIPPVTMRRELLRLLRHHVAGLLDRKERAMEFAIAYGCGWSRVPDNSTSWAGVWDNAVLGLLRALEPAVGEADRWLRTNNLVCYDTNKDRSDLPLDAAELAMRLVRPMKEVSYARQERVLIENDVDRTEIVSPRHSDQLGVGAKRAFSILSGTPAVSVPRRLRAPLAAGTHVFVTASEDDTRLVARADGQVFRAQLRAYARATIGSARVFTVGFWRCTCATARCPERHRLKAWQPELPLWSFVSSAVKGPNEPIKTGSFAQGMYYGLLTE